MANKMKKKNINSNLIFNIFRELFLTTKITRVLRNSAWKNYENERKRSENNNKYRKKKSKKASENNNKGNKKL